jgi:hypothetical protein
MMDKIFPVYCKICGRPVELIPSNASGDMVVMAPVYSCCLKCVEEMEIADMGAPEHERIQY